MSLSKQKSVDETDFDESSLKFLGKGTYGTVYRVAVEPGKSAVCVKYLKPSNDSDFESLFVKECAILKKLQHLNIIQYHHKIRIPEKRRYGIVTEYCERGTLQNVIMSSSISYTIWMVVDWSEGLFRALKYLQENHTILHRDIKPSNIFMTHTFIPKIGDFGSTKLYEKTTMNSRHTGTDLYMAPETYIEDKNSPKSDVYSLFLCIWEMIERRIVFLPKGATINTFNVQKLFNTMEKTRIVPIEKPECPTKLQEMIISGCSFEYKMRPSIAQIIDGFVQLKKEEDIKRFESQRPREDPKQMEIVRPMEFDGSIVKRKNSDDIFGWDTLQVSNPSNHFKTETTSQIKKTESKKTVSMKDQKQEVGFIQKFELICKSFTEKYEALSDDAKKYFGMVTNFVQSNLEKNDLIFHEFVPAILPIDRDDSLEKLLEKRLIYEFHAQYQFYLMTFDLLATLKQTWIGYLDLFDEHEDLLKYQKVLKDGQMWKKGFHFYNYFLNSTKEQWFLVRVEDERSLFLEKSLVKVRWFDGEWVNNQENKYWKFCILEEDGLQMEFRKIEVFDLNTMITRIEKEITFRMNDNEKQMNKKISEINDVKPLFDYFDIKRLPRVSRFYQPLCEKVITDQFEPLLIPLFGCSTLAVIDQVTIFTIICKLMYHLQKRSVNMWKRLSEKEDYKCRIYRHLNDLDFQKACRKTTLKFCRVKVLGEKDQYLLSLPKDFQKVETLHCFDDNFNIIKRKVSKRMIDFKNPFIISVFDFLNWLLEK